MRNPLSFLGPYALIIVIPILAYLASLLMQKTGINFWYFFGPAATLYLLWPFLRRRL